MPKILLTRLFAFSFVLFFPMVALADDLSGDVLFYDPFISENRTLSVGPDGCVSAEFGMGTTTTRTFCITVGGTFTLNPPGDDYGPYISYSPSGGDSDPVTLALEFFDAFFGAISTNAGIIALLIATIAGFNALVILSERFTSLDDELSRRAKRISQETDRLLAEDDAKGHRFRT